MPTTSVDIPETLKDEMEAAVESGPYTSNSELVRDAIRRLLDARADRLSQDAIEALQDRLDYDDSELLSPRNVDR